MEYKVMNYSDAVLPRLFHFYKEMIGEVFHSEEKGPQLLSHILRKPNFDAGKDLLIAEVGKTIVGILFLISELKIGRIVLSCQIHQDFPYQSVASALWKEGIQRCKEIGGKKIHVSVHEDFKAARDFFTKAGFSVVRIFLELQCDLKNTEQIFSKGRMGPHAHFKEGEEALLAELQNRIFKGSWGFCPNTEEEIKYYLGLTQCRVTDVLLLKNVEDVIGYFWAHASPRGDSSLKKGRIHMFGIAQEFQRRGLGKKLLKIGLEDMKAKGFEVVDLTVDRENRPAVILYNSFGFRENYASFWYEKRL